MMRNRASVKNTDKNNVQEKPEDTVEKRILSVVYQAYKNIDTSVYTKESAENFRKAVAEAERVLDAHTATDEEMQAAAEYLLKTAAALVPDTESLELAATKAKEEEEKAKAETIRNLEKIRVLEEKINFTACNTKVRSVKSKRTKELQIAWKRIANAEGYQIRYSMNSTFKKAKTITVKSGTVWKKTIAGLKKGKKYYVKVRAYRILDGEKVYTRWSAKKAAKVK
ncbi:MAG: fibronectin type III domain-containing protein [Hominisplanchenecus sp.]|nr:fibronectin type III domain-containing protein [Lachnospiraceae bacterium]MDY2819009.1 fibronectin type III domain-containing protein [Hominisplanchenecus sp.]